MHHPKSHPSCDSYPVPGAALKIPGHACHGKPVCLRATKKVLLPCVFLNGILAQLSEAIAIVEELLRVNDIHFIGKIVWQK